MEKIKTDGLKEVASEVIGLEHNKIFTTIKYLTIKPGQVVSEFSSGEKHKYISPVVYFLGVQAVKLYLMSISGISDFLLKRNLDNIVRWFNSFPSLASSKNETDKFIHDFSGFLSFFFTDIGREIIGLPILLLLSWLFYRRFNKSFKENSWFALYTWGHASFLSIPIVLIFYITNEFYSLFVPLTLLIIVLYCTWASIKFYKLRPGWALALRVLMIIAYSLALSLTANMFFLVSRLFTS